MHPECKQLLVVTTPSLHAVEGTMIPYNLDEKGEWRQAWSPFAVVVGRNGMACVKREGDGCSPIGCFPLVQAFGKETAPSVRMPYLAIEGLEGVDDPDSRYYNRLVRSAEISDRDWESSERMDDYAVEYAWGVVVGYNWEAPKPHAGSCIFLHIWKTPHDGTAGCTAMEAEEMRKLVEWLDPACHPHLLQAPKELYKNYFSIRNNS